MRYFYILSSPSKIFSHWSTHKTKSLISPCKKFYSVTSDKSCSHEAKPRRVKDEEIQFQSKRIVPEKFNFASDVLDQWAEKEKEGIRTSAIPAFWFVYQNGNELKLNFQELQHQSKRVTIILESCCGIKRNDNVIVMLPRIPEYWLINIAAMRTGFVMSPANMMLTVKDISYRLSALESTHVIAHESVADLVDEAAKSCSTLKDKIIVSDNPVRRKGWHDLNHLIPGTNDHKCAKTGSEETMMIFFTSGTTGKPKMVEHAHRYAIGMQDFGKYTLDLTSENIAWIMADTGWAFTTYGLLGVWSQGACLFIHQMLKFCPKLTLDVLVKYPIDTLLTAPLVYKTLIRENLANYKFKKLEHCFTGGETLHPDVQRKWMDGTGLRLYNGFGQSETTGVLSMRKTHEYRIGSVGKPRLEGSVTIVDENEKELGPGEIGEIVLKRDCSVGIFKGYKNNPEATAAVLTEKYFHTGDMGYYDDEGYFWFVGRNDDLINSAGYRIGPSEVEDALMDHPAIGEVAVISSPDEKRGEVVKAFIVLHESFNPNEDLIKDIQEHCKRVTAPYKYPRKIEFVKTLPKTVTGKIKRSDLRKKEWEIMQNQN